MGTKVASSAKEFSGLLRSLQDDQSRNSCTYEEDINVTKMRGDKIPAMNLYCANQTIFVCERAVSKITEPGDELNTETSDCSADNDADDDNVHEDSCDVLRTEQQPQPLTVMKARQLLSLYTLSQNPGVTAADNNPVLHPLWVQCDMSDPAGTVWFGAEPVCVGNKVTGIKLYSVTCKGSAVEKQSLVTLEELKQMHKNRHHTSSIGIKGSARFSLFGSTVVENTIIGSQSSVTVDFKWSHVESILEVPPLSSTATIIIKVVCGDPRSPMFEMYREIEFLRTRIKSISHLQLIHIAGANLTNTRNMDHVTTVRIACHKNPLTQRFRDAKGRQHVVSVLLGSGTNSLKFTLADGLKTGETEWMEPVESTSAVNLTKAYLEELRNIGKTLQDQAAKTAEAQKLKQETEPPIFNSLERGDLDFVEQLWVRMRKSVTSYQDVGDCLKLVVEALRYGEIKPWIHRDSSSSLSKLIRQSYHQQIDHVSLTGITPVIMLLEMGLDKLRKDYINYLIGEELTTLNHLCYYLSTEVDLQEQVMRLRKLHHLLEIIVTCSTFLGLPYDRLFVLTQLCLNHYKTSTYNEEHEFKLQIKPALITHFFQKEHPVVWGVEISSGQGIREVWTSLQLSDKPLVDHVLFETDFPNETVNGDEEPAFFSTMVCSSFNSFA